MSATIREQASAGSGDKPKVYAVVAGLLGLVIVVGGIFAEAIVRGGVIVAGDALATSTNIVAAEPLFRSGILAELVMLCSDLAYTVLLYILLRPSGRVLAGIAGGLRLVTITILGGAALLQLSAVMLLQPMDYIGVFSEAQRQALALYCLRLHAGAYHIALIFFALHLVLLGVLVFRSGFLPAWLGLGLVVAAVCYAINSSASLLALDCARHLFPWILLPCLVAETALSLWLLIKGVDSAEWQKKQAQLLSNGSSDHG